MTQSTTELLQAIKGLAEKADQAFIEAMAAIDSGKNQQQIDELRGIVGKTHDDLAHALMRNLPTLIAALELKERVDGPETVELVARAICADDPDVRMGDCKSVVQQRVQHEWKHYKRTAEATLKALKGQTDAG